jgi:hypothetical protein
MRESPTTGEIFDQMTADARKLVKLLEEENITIDTLYTCEDLVKYARCVWSRVPGGSGAGCDGIVKIDGVVQVMKEGSV